MIAASVHGRVVTAGPFVALGIAAIVAGGLVAAVSAHHPTRNLVWMAAYLVLVAGVIQCVLGAGQAWLAERPPRSRSAWGQWGLFNLANAGIIAGTLCSLPGLVAAATVLFLAALLWFFGGVRRCRRRGWGVAYRVLLALVSLGACVGLVFSILSNGSIQAGPFGLNELASAGCYSGCIVAATWWRTS
ncbi:MAG: hypothetical protein L0I62_10300 [Gammaproteobacteria bacterium]|nr:hypothetical protein [Gammaproteobacteria bacterium]